MSKKNRNYLKTVRNFFRFLSESSYLNKCLNFLFLVHGTSGDISLYSVCFIGVVVGFA